MIYLLRNKKTGHFLCADPVIRAEHIAWSDPYHYAGIELKDLDYEGPVFATTNLDDAQDLLKEGKCETRKLAIDFGWGQAKFELSDLEIITLDPSDDARRAVAAASLTDEQLAAWLEVDEEPQE